MDVSVPAKVAGKRNLLKDFREYGQDKVQEALDSGPDGAASATAIRSSIEAVERTIDRFGHPTALGYEAALSRVADRVEREARHHGDSARNMKITMFFGGLLFLAGIVLGWAVGFDMFAAALSASGFAFGFTGAMGAEYYKSRADRLQREAARVVSWDQAITASHSNN